MKHKFTFLAFLLAMLAIPHHAIAEYDFSAIAPTGQTLYYTITGSNEVSVTYPGTASSDPYNGFTTPTGDLSIPSTVTNDDNTYSVTSIGNYAFFHCFGLTSLTLPNSIISIGGRAFSGCHGLTSVNIPNSVTSIGSFAFSSCMGLTSLTLPNSVISIDSCAFSDCYGLTSLSIPNSVTSIGDRAFGFCHNLASIEVSSGNTVYDSRENCNAIIETASSTLIRGCESTTIPNSVTTIGEYAFYGCYGLTSLNIPNSVTTIGKYAFCACIDLTSLTIPNSITSIEMHTFTGCTGLTSVTIPNSVTSIGKYAFCMCRGLTTLTIPNSITSINDYAFSECSGLTSVTIPSSVTSIGNTIFINCIGLATIEVSSANAIFDSRDNCNAIIETASNTLICGCANTTIPNSVTSIGDSAFYECRSLTSMTIPNSITSIGRCAFAFCNSLTEINCLSVTAPTLGNNAFYDVDNTIPVNIPCGSLASYQSGWSHFSNFNEVFSPYTLDVYSSDDAMGSASITTLPNCDNQNTAVVEATAHAGYRFDHWSDGTTANPYTVQLTRDTTLVAHFSANTGIDELDDSGILVYAKDHQIHIDAAIGEAVNVYTIDGRAIATLPKATEHVAIPVTTAGVYLVKIGNHPARKVVVIW